MQSVFAFLRGKIQKSAGVPVTPAVYRAISLGNECRNDGSWRAAARHFGNALSLDPSLIHIWVQLGHMRKEAGDPNGAADAYMSALRLQPTDHALVGWLYGIAGRLAPERRRAVINEIYSLQGKSFEAAVSDHRLLLRPTQDEIIFDVSDLIAYFSRARRPTGIQRVQIEIIRSALQLTQQPIRICCSIEQSLCWVEISGPLFQRVVQLAVSGDHVNDVEWRDVIQDLNAALAFGSPFEFGDSARLVNLGTSWWLQNYFLQVRNAQINHGIEYIPFVHDLIPVLAPQHCVQGLVQDFTGWILGVFEHARRFLVNSEATKRDLLKVARMLGRALEEESITVVPLDGAFQLPASDCRSPLLLESRLDDRPFVLFVSTIESRKGHLVALRAWQRLLADNPRETPYLVFVGNNGWLNRQVYALLETDAVLRERVILFSGLPDNDLAHLYRECLFTIYPSTYEGWGLPITEALNFGKLVIAADNSSLPEAGRAHAVYTRTLDDLQLAQEVARYASDRSLLAEREREIRATFRPRSWGEIAHQILQAVRSGEIPMEGTGIDRPPPRIGQWLDFRRQIDIEDCQKWASGERLRYGTGWSAPDDLGCWLVEETATLRFQPFAGNNWFVVLLQAACTGRWHMKINGETVDEGEISGPSQAWAACSVAPTSRPIVVTISGIKTGVGKTFSDERWLGVRGCILASRSSDIMVEINRAVASGRIDASQDWSEPGCVVEAARKIARIERVENRSEN